MGEYISIISGVFLAFLMIIIIQKFMDVFLAERSNNIIKYVFILFSFNLFHCLK